MNTPARFESLLWMASPLMAWAQASAEAPPKPSVVKPSHRAAANRASRPRRKRDKVLA